MTETKPNEHDEQEAPSPDEEDTASGGPAQHPDHSK